MHGTHTAQYFSECGGNISEKLHDVNRFNIFRYVDDFLLLSKTAGVPSNEMADVLGEFRSCGKGLGFCRM